MLYLVEDFLSIDGEGSRAGEPTIFVRFAGCNLNCCYCDSKYSWDTSAATPHSIDTIIEKVNYLSNDWVKNVTITGGEPLLNEEVDELIFTLCQLGYNVNVETNGTIIPRINHPNLFYTVDYKCLYSQQNHKMNLDIYKHLTSNDIVKFVVANKEDMEDTLKIVKAYPYLNYYYSPVFGQIELVDIVNFILENELTNAKLQVQLHKIVWDPDMKGV